MLAGNSRHARAAVGDDPRERSSGTGGIGVLERADDLVEVASVRPQQLDDRLRIRREDLRPQRGVARCDPGGVAQPLAGERHRLVGGRGQPLREEARDELRDVGDERDGGVVIGRAHLQRQRADVERERLDDREVLPGGLVVAAHDPGSPDEEVGAAGDRATALSAGHGVGADVATQVDAAAAELAQRLELHARDVGDDRVGEGRELGLDDVGDDIRGHGHDDEPRRIPGGRPAPSAVVDRERERRARGVGELDLDAERGERVPEGGAEQARTDDADRSRGARRHTGAALAACAHLVTFSRDAPVRRPRPRPLLPGVPRRGPVEGGHPILPG